MTLLELIKDRCVINDDGCWIWAGCLSTSGRPVAGYRGSIQKNGPVQRMTWAEHHGTKFPRKMVAAPLCHDLRCVRPECIEPITRKEAMRRASAAGKLSCGALHSIATTRKNRERAATVLTMEKARELRARYAEIGNAAQVAREFSLNHAHVHRVVRNQSWVESNPWTHA